MQIKSLEDDLGIKLFEKEGNNLKATKKADMLYKMAIPIIHGADALFESFLNESNKEDENFIHFACRSDGSFELLPKHIKYFTKNNPNIVFEIEYTTIMVNAIKGVIERKLDFAIFPVDTGQRTDGNVDYIDFYEDNLSLVMHKEHPLAKKNENDITMNDIAESNLVLMDKKLFYDNKHLYFLINNKNFYNNLLFQNANWEIVKTMVKENICITGMTEKYINEEDRKYMVTKKVKNIFPTFKYCIIKRKNSLFNPNIKKFLKLLKNDIQL